MPGKLILVRHGQSIWNVENLFTGWHDVDLSEQGRREAAEAAIENGEFLIAKIAADNGDHSYIGEETGRNREMRGRAS